MNEKIALISLGCPKNLINSEQMLNLLDDAGYELVDDPDDYDQIWAYTDEPIGLEDTWYEARYREVFGDHLFVGRQYVIRHGLEINDLEETEVDRIRAEKGNISLQLRNPEIDNTHLNEMGYRAVAQGVYEQGKILGYWK